MSGDNGEAYTKQMSPTRKPKPPDKGAPPEHKPSRKVALEEVMRSLQDLVSNELAIEPAKPPAAKTTKTAPTEKKSDTRSAFSADVLPAVTPVAPEPATESIVPDRVFPTPSPAAIPDIVDELPDLGAGPLTAPAETPPATRGAAPLGGLQQELPYLEAAPPAPQPAPSPEAAEAEVTSFLPEVLPIDAAKTDMVADNNTPASAAEEINWDDFPVLEEAVELPEEVDADGAAQGTGTSQVAMLPPADAARRLAIQVAARLNVELRKSGQDGLNSDIITRLARLLQEALAKGAPNMENTTVNKASYTDGGSAENAGAVFRPPPDKH